MVVDDQFHLRVDSNNPSGCQPIAIKELDSRNMGIDFEAVTRSVGLVSIIFAKFKKNLSHSVFSTMRISIYQAR